MDNKLIYLYIYLIFIFPYFILGIIKQKNYNKENKARKKIKITCNRVFYIYFH